MHILMLRIQVFLRVCVFQTNKFHIQTRQSLKLSSEDHLISGGHQQTTVHGRPSSAYRINSPVANVPTVSSPVDTHVNFNYSKYYEENIKQIKSKYVEQ